MSKFKKCQIPEEQKTGKISEDHDISKYFRFLDAWKTVPSHNTTISELKDLHVQPVRSST